MEGIPEQEYVCVFDWLRSEKIVCLDRNLAVSDRPGLKLVPVLRVFCRYMHSNVDIYVEVLTVMASSLTVGRSWMVNLSRGFFFMIS